MDIRRIVLGLALLAFASPLIAQSPPSKSVLRAEAQKLLEAKNYPEAALKYEALIRYDRKNVSVFYDYACCLALSGRKEEAFRTLDRAIDAGYRDANHLLSDDDLEGLRSDEKWQKSLEHVKKKEQAYLRDLSDPGRAKFVTSDIRLFWKVFDLAMKAKPEERESIFDREYFDRGTIGLSDFKAVRRIPSKRLVSYIEKHPKFFAAVRSETLKVESQKREVLEDFRRMKAIYPAATFPPVYFCIGPFSGGGTVSQNGLLLSAEMVAKSEGMPTEELSDWERSVMSGVTDLPPLISHELIHFQQKYPTHSTLLAACIQEGSADFLSEKIAGRLMERTREVQHRYGNAHEQELWDQFQTEMQGKVTRNWLYSGSEKGERPVDMGYWMGYKICEAYYNGMADKSQAVRDILEIKDFPEFLKASGYGRGRE